ncbi:MAG: enoyl-CoA hydratase/isomerase family protein [Deltaproteobacteria bacterium]|nr:enoyl-CoA hydratase/isomerase family protein [Deltaproteobacteria bacterium]
MKNSLVSLQIADAEAKLRIEREESLNALNVEVLEGLKTHLIALAKLPFSECRVVSISSAGDRAFVAGADIKCMLGASPSDLHYFIALGQDVTRQLERLPVPVIAVVNGYAIGGGLELALACDMILATTTAKLGQAEVNLGLIPGFGGTQRLPLRVGIGAAKRLILTAETISSSEAYRLGLVDWLVEPTELQKKLGEIVENLKTKAPLALKAAKRSIENLYFAQKTAGLSQEVEEFVQLFKYNDTREGLGAFVEKRKPTFKGC